MIRSIFFFRRGAWLAVVGCLTSAGVAAADYYVPAPVYRTGLYAAAGTSYYAGVLDYYKLLNLRDGGVSGVKLVWDECETERDLKKGVACYHRLKQSKRGEALYFDPWSPEISSALIGPSRKDRLPVISVNHGVGGAERGDVFPYLFPLGADTYDFAHVALQYIIERLGGAERLKGQKIATLFHGSPYGRATHEFLDLLGELYGFEHVPIEVPHPGNEQNAQWLQIRRLKPAFVFLRGWGLMNPAAIQAAARSGYSAARLIGNEWSNSDEDVLPAGAAADGYQAVTVQRAGGDFPAAQEIIERLYNAGEGGLEDKDLIGSGYWNLGVWTAVMVSEAIRAAQRRFGKQLTAPMVRWGLENFELTGEDLERIGLSDVAPPIKLSCSDHAALHRARVQQWDAKARKWQLVTGWIEGRSEISRKIIDESAEQYAAEHPDLPRRDCTDPDSRDNFDLSD